MKKPVIPIVFSTDNNFVPYCGVAISSLTHHTSFDVDYNIFVFHTELSEYSIRRLESLSYLNIKVECVNVTKYLSKVKLYTMHHFSEATFYRIVIPEVFSHYTRVLYLDCDLIVLSDVKELYDMDLNRNVLGVCRRKNLSRIEDYVINKLNLTAIEYFNAGVLVFNIKYFIEEQIKEKCYNLINHGLKYDYVDQDVLNIVCRNKIEILPAEWNYLSNYDDIENNNIKPKILHYVTAEKPWCFPNVPNAKVFWKVARKTKFFYEILLKHINCDVDTFELNLYKEYENALTKD
ncbi:MAG: glycosyltransferase family 8 protein [Oscillospiraceae bacterium]|jgi:lipopolysaccharide biosynthesis glycosyltransferase|nr:glycosyltransferase family 8 protein [Oscillospiraceae bacterium]